MPEFRYWGNGVMGRSVVGGEYTVEEIIHKLRDADVIIALGSARVPVRSLDRAGSSAKLAPARDNYGATEYFGIRGSAFYPVDCGSRPTWSPQKPGE